MSARVRTAEPSDEPALIELIGMVQALHVSQRPETFRPISGPEIAAWLAKAVKDPERNIWVAEVDGAVCGYLLSVIRKQTENPFVYDRTWFELDQICVDPAQRRKGVAKALVAAATAYADAHGFRDVELSTWAFNHDAQRAFAKLGLVPKVIRFEVKGRTEARETSHS
jgi:ribosomal protein S18 acetylase RimI-like enzyme